MKTPLIAAAVMLAALTSGCVSLLPKSEPAQLYKLSYVGQGASAPTGAPVVQVLRTRTQFPRVAASDRILTTTGNEAASIANVRWAAPVQIQFDEAMAAAFDATPGVRLQTRASAAPPDATLRVEVRTFEAQYRNGQKSAPTIVVAGYALLSAVRGGPVEDHPFHAEVTAADNRVGAIVDAYNSASTQALSDIAAWTARSVKPAP